MNIFKRVHDSDTLDLRPEVKPLALGLGETTGALLVGCGARKLTLVDTLEPAADPWLTASTVHLRPQFVHTSSPGQPEKRLYCLHNRNARSVLTNTAMCVVLASACVCLCAWVCVSVCVFDRGRNVLCHLFVCYPYNAQSSAVLMLLGNKL